MIAASADQPAAAHSEEAATKPRRLTTRSGSGAGPPPSQNRRIASYRCTGCWYHGCATANRRPV